MIKVNNVGNLPAHLQAFAKELGGKLSNTSTEFYEMSSVDDLEKNATEIGYEIIPTIDNSTGRGFLVGFDVTEPERIATLLQYSTLKIYFVECSSETIKEWTEKIKLHRELQQADMFERKEVVRLNRAARRKLRFQRSKP